MEMTAHFIFSFWIKIYIAKFSEHILFLRQGSICLQPSVSEIELSSPNPKSAKKQILSHWAFCQIPIGFYLTFLSGKRFLNLDALIFFFFIMLWRFCFLWRRDGQQPRSLTRAAPPEKTKSPQQNEEKTFFTRPNSKIVFPTKISNANFINQIKLLIIINSMQFIFYPTVRIFESNFVHQVCQASSVSGRGEGDHHLGWFFCFRRVLDWRAGCHRHRVRRCPVPRPRAQNWPSRKVRSQWSLVRPHGCSGPSWLWFDPPFEKRPR